MNPVISMASLLMLAFSIPAWADDAAEPRTGYFRVSRTPIEILGPAGADAVAGILQADEEIEWEVIVPPNYNVSSPPGLIVYINSRDSGAPPRDWNDMLAERNLIWIGARDSGNDWPVPQRMLKAMLAPLLMDQTHRINPARVYIAGMSGGSKTATRVAVARPEMFKGGIYMAGTVFWGDNLPTKIDLVRENYHAFVIGTNDPALTEAKLVYNDYKNAGVINSKLITINNFKHRMPPVEYFEKAITFLDSRYEQ